MDGKKEIIINLKKKTDIARVKGTLRYVAGFTAIVGKLGNHLTVAAFRLAPPPHWHYCSPGRCACRVEVPE